MSFAIYSHPTKVVDACALNKGDMLTFHIWHAVLIFKLHYGFIFGTVAAEHAHPELMIVVEDRGALIIGTKQRVRRDLCRASITVSSVVEVHCPVDCPSYMHPCC